MFKILDARQLASDVKWFRIEAPLVAKHRQPGQFVILRLQQTGERIPLTMANADRNTGTIELIVKAIGKTTRELCRKQAGDTIADVMGPSAVPRRSCCRSRSPVGGGVGTAVIYPLVTALREAGCFVSSITAAERKSWSCLRTSCAGFSNVVYATTDDGSYGFKGTVADKLRELIADKRRPIGGGDAPVPVPMMRAVCELTRSAGIKTIVSLNPIMIDGTGMCGGCRVTVGDKTKYACVDGPEFDGHLVNFAELSDRLTTYRKQEQISLERAEHAGHQCRLNEPAKVSR
jgi:ferredoxin--NADP+ reductase